MKTLKKALCLVLCILMAMSTVVFAGAENEAADKTGPITQEDFLTVKGRKLVNQKGENVQLKGVNLGAWLVRENWLNPDCIDVEYKSKMTAEEQANYWGTFYEDLTAEQKEIFDRLVEECAKEAYDNFNAGQEKAEQAVIEAGIKTIDLVPEQKKMLEAAIDETIKENFGELYFDETYRTALGLNG